MSTVEGPHPVLSDSSGHIFFLRTLHRSEAHPLQSGGAAWGQSLMPEHRAEAGVLSAVLCPEPSSPDNQQVIWRQIPRAGESPVPLDLTPGVVASLGDP